MGIINARGYWAGAIEEQGQQFIKYNCKKSDFEHRAVISGTRLYDILLRFYCSNDHSLCLITGWFCMYATWALQISVPPSLNKFPFGEQKVSSFAVCSQRLGSENIARSRVQYLYCCLLDGFQKWGTMDSARCSRNLHLPLWAQYWRIKTGFFWHCHLWNLPCTDCSLTSKVWGQHSRNYNTWWSTPQENSISVEDSSVISYIRLQQTFQCFSPWGHCNSWSPGSPLSQILCSDTIIMDLFCKFSSSLSLWSVGKLRSFSINTERSANSFLLCAIHSYGLPTCCSFAQGVESTVDRQWFYKAVLLSSLRNQYQLPWCPKNNQIHRCNWKKWKNI